MAKRSNPDPKTILQDLQSFAVYDPESGHFICTRQKTACSTPVGQILGTFSCVGIVIRVAGRTFLAHRLAWLWMTGEWPVEDIDHIDGKRWNNSWTNLRAVSRAINSRNQRKRDNNRSGVTNVCWHKGAGKWMARARDENSQGVYLGLFSSLEEAKATVQKFYTANPGLGYTARHGK